MDIRIAALFVLFVVVSTHQIEISKENQESQLKIQFISRNKKAEQYLNDWLAYDCSSFSNMQVTSMAISAQPNINLDFDFMAKGKIGHNINFTSVKYQVFKSLIKDGGFQHNFTDKYVEGQSFVYQSPYIHTSIGQEGLWTFFVNFYGTIDPKVPTNRVGCMMFNVIAKQKTNMKKANQLE